jgi:Tol biopolymer transport system component
MPHRDSSSTLLRFTRNLCSLILLQLLLIGYCLVQAGTGPTASRTNRGSATADNTGQPEIFGAGVISTGDFDSHPAFTPDGKTIYFLRSTPNFDFWTIVVSHFERGSWRTPEVAPFSGQYSDADPHITADGSKFYFISNRPAPGKQKEDLDIWMMDKTPAGWSEPRHMSPPINSEGNEWYPTVTREGHIYFGSDRAGGKGRTDLYRSRLVNGTYAPAENLGDSINTQFNEFEPWISPDERFLIFMAGGRPDSRGAFDLYISYNRQGAWTKPENLGDKINSSGNESSPLVTSDGKYFFWTSTRATAGKPSKRRTYRELTESLRGPGNGLGDIYRVSIGELKLK